MLITSIKQQVKNPNRFSIFIDNKYSFSLNQDDLIKLNLKTNQELSKEDLDGLGVEVEFAKAKNDCFRFLSYRDRSKGEIEDYLKRKKYDEDITKGVVSYLIENNLINDEKFAKQWFENRVALKKASIKQIKLELRQKKIDESTISKIIEEEDIDEVTTIKELVERSQPKYQDDLKLMQLLSRRGFSYDKILIALGRRTE